MKKKPTIIVLLTLLVLSKMVMSQHQNQTVTEGCMSLTVPSDYKIEKDSGSIGSSLMLTSDNTLYLIMEMNYDVDADFMMQNSILKNSALSTALWDDVKDCTFLSFDAKTADFTMTLENETRYGSTLAFNGGNGKTYGIMVLKTTKQDILTDTIINTLKLKNDSRPSTEKYATTREEVLAFIAELRPNFGSPLEEGVTLDNIELDPRKDVLTYTFGIQLFSKSDLEQLSNSEKKELTEEMRSVMVELVKNMKAFSAMKRCMDEGYTFVINCIDKDCQQLFSFTLRKKDYK